MVNKPKNRSRRQENQKVELLHDWGFQDAFRPEGGKRTANDILGMPWPVECKAQKRWSLMAWIRHMTKHHGEGAEWMMFLEHSDRRLAEAPEPVVVMPEWLALSLMNFALFHGYFDSHELTR